MQKSITNSSYSNEVIGGLDVVGMVKVGFFCSGKE